MVERNAKVVASNLEKSPDKHRGERLGCQSIIVINYYSLFHHFSYLFLDSSSSNRCYESLIEKGMSNCSTTNIFISYFVVVVVVVNLINP